MNPAPPPSAGGRTLVVVAGPGRSGTSLYAGLTGILGLYIPQPEVSWNRSNPRGFSEPRWAVEFHRELLEQVGVHVDDARPEAWDRMAALADDAQVRGDLSTWLTEQFAQAERVIVKDPRLAWFLELYRRVTTDIGVELKVATLLRDPAEVLKSREIAYGDKVSPLARAVGWINVMLGSELRTRDHRRAVVPYEELLADWRGTLERTDGALGLDLLGGAGEAALADADELVDPSLRRSRSTLAELGITGPVADLTERTVELFGRLAAEAGAGEAATLSALDALREDYAACYAEAADIAQSSVRASRREGREQGARRMRREMEAAQASRTGLRQRAARVLRGAKA